MSLFETGHATGTVSLAGLLDGTAPSCPDPGLTVRDLAERISVGGWPGHLGYTQDQSLRAVRDYLDEVARVDIHRIDQSRRDPVKVTRFLRSFARNVATYAAATTLVADAAGDGGPVDDDTVRSYLAALDRLMIVEDQPAWAPHLRSRSILRRGAKRHFVDPSLAVGALRATPERLLKDLKLLGFLFESLVVRDLRIYAQAVDAEVLQYRDNTGLEVDAIVESTDGRWVAVEVKLGAGMVDAGADTLKSFRERVDTRKCGDPSALVVITGAGYGYTRDDGVVVVPLAALGP